MNINNRYLKLFLMMSIGMGLASCASTKDTAQDSHPESQYAEGFGGNGEHIHDLHPQKNQDN